MESDDLRRMRLDYETGGIDASTFPDDPLAQFDRWFADAVAAQIEEPNAVVVSTVDGDGQPWSRYVLLKGLDPRGFSFYSNYGSNKSRDLAAQPKAALTFGWLELHRQVNVAGAIERVDPSESDDYWSVRARGSQLGAWASDQSRPVASRDQLLAAYSSMEERYPDGPIPRPPHWGGWRLIPHTVEFWQGRRNRLHDRLRYVRSATPDTPDGIWELVRLSP